MIKLSRDENELKNCSVKIIRKTDRSKIIEYGIAEHCHRPTYRAYREPVLCLYLLNVDWKQDFSRLV